jgi:hypothetical protein
MVTKQFTAEVYSRVIDLLVGTLSSDEHLNYWSTIDDNCTP